MPMFPSLQLRTFPHLCRLHEQRLPIEAEIIFGIRDSTLHEGEHRERGSLGLLCELNERDIDLHTDDRPDHEAALPGSDTEIFEGCDYFHSDI
jgi:hypothetical protein